PLRQLRLEGRIPGGFGRFPCGDGLQRSELSARMPVQEFEARCTEETPEPRRMTEVLRANVRLREIPERLHEEDAILERDPRDRIVRKPRIGAAPREHRNVPARE